MEKFIRNNAGVSSYFNGGYSRYGRYQWNVKYYQFNDEFEIEMASEHFIDWLSENLKKDIDFHFAGRSGGWFVVDTELTSSELKILDACVKECMENLPYFLSMLRTSNQDNE